MGRRITAIKDGYNNNGLWAAVKEVPIQSWDLVKENKGKTALTVAALVVVTAYVVSASYRNFVYGVGKGAVAGVTGVAHTVAGAHASAVSFLGSKIPFIGTGIFTQILVGAVMVAAAAAFIYGLYKGLEKAHLYLTSTNGPSGPKNSPSTEHNDSNTNKPNDPRAKDDPRTGVSDPSADVGGDKQKTPA